MNAGSAPQSLALLNKHIRECLNQLNAVVYLQVELDLEGARIHELTQLYKSLNLVREDARQELARQLESFNEQFGSSPRAFFALMYEKLNAEMPSTEPDLWIIMPPFTPLNTSIAHIRVSRWNRLVAVSRCAMRVCTQRYYYTPRLSRTRAAKDLEFFQEKLRVAQGIEQNLQQELHQYESRYRELQKDVLKVRHELANPSELYETVPAYFKYSHAARQYFCDLRITHGEKTLPHLNASSVKMAAVAASRNPVHALARQIPCSVFKSFEEHHGICLDSGGSWELQTENSDCGTLGGSVTQHEPNSEELNHQSALDEIPFSRDRFSQHSQVIV